MALNQAFKPNTIDHDCDDKQIPAAEILSSPDKIGALNDLDGTVMLQIPSGHTPVSRSFQNASRASSARSSSPTPSIFDDDLYPAETPLTAPLSNQSRPSSSSRLGVETPQKISTLSFVDKHATVQTSRGTPQGSITSVLEVQIAEQHVLETVDDYFTSGLAQMKLGESPTAQKMRRRKRKQEVAAAVETISTQLSYLNVDINNTGPGHHGETTGRAEDELYQESYGSIEHSIMVPVQHEMSNLSLPEFDKRRKKAAKSLPSSPTPEFLIVEEAHQQRRSQPPITPFLDPLVSRSSPKISARISAPDLLGADIELRIDIREQLDEGFGSPADYKSAASSSHSKISAAGKSQNSSLSLHDDEVHRIDRTMAPRKSGRKSLPVEGNDAAQSMDLTYAEDMNTSFPREKKALQVKKVSKVISHVFEKFNNEEKSSNELKLEILRVVRQKVYEDKLLKSLATRFLAAFPRKWQKRLFPRHPLSSHETDLGSIYIFKSDACPGHVKIGKTKQKLKSRISQWSKKCKLTYIHVVDLDDKSFYNYGIVEKLVQAELWNLRRKFECEQCNTHASHNSDEPGEIGPTMHGEWYEITDAQALEIVQKWRKWIVKSEPYLQTGVLRQYWKWKHDQAMKVEVDWVKWRSSNQYEVVKYFWHCIHKTIADYFMLAVAFVWLLGAANLFLPSDGYCLRVGKATLATAILFISYRCIYW